MYTCIFISVDFFDNTDSKDMINILGIIIDVRLEAGFYAGTVENSLNISFGDLSSKLGCLNDKDQEIITCFGSDIRSADAKKLLSAKGYTNLVNRGAWSNLECKLK